MTKETFLSALPVWEKGSETEMNRQLVFRTVLKKQTGVTVRLAAQARYLLLVNGRFAGIGPARAGHGFYRVDEYDVTSLLTKEENVLSVTVAGYNVNSFAYLDEPSFLCCEVLRGKEILAATGRFGFDAFTDTRRREKVQRYSFQRPFVESYTFDAGYDALETQPSLPARPVETVLTAPKNFLTRGVPYTDGETVFAEACIEHGGLLFEKPEKYFDDRAISAIGPKLKGYRREELEELTVCDAENQQPDHAATGLRETAEQTLPANSYAIWKLPKNLTGLIELRARPAQDTTLYLVFDEVFNQGKVDFTRMSCSNVVVWHLAGGTEYSLRSFEPYTMQYIEIMSVGGETEIEGLSLRRFDFPARLLTQTVAMPGQKLQRIYDAALESFRQNTLDIYMDCPSRERAGWLCDSFFTSRVEYALTGRCEVEHNFLENFLMPEQFACLPKGMLPMCYPSDHYDGVFIPNWAMWFVLELEEYQTRSGDRALVEAAKKRVYDLLGYFRRFENADGLLEKLESWVFVEWSRSNDLVQDINYPTNMLYARMKEAMASLYGDETLRREAAELKEAIRRQSFTGAFFCDNAVYGADGKAVLSGETTESCQYYAFFTGTATPKTYPELWHILLNDFGPERVKEGKYPQVAPANAFIGNYLRLELLFSEHEYDRVLENIAGYFDYMALKTGTLWENAGDYASCDHGFASHVAYWLNALYGVNPQ